MIGFRMDSGETRAYCGPWHSNSEGLLKDTGVDLRDRHESFGVISLGRMYTTEGWMMRGILHYDGGPIVGPFDRIERLAQSWANTRQQSVWFFARTANGEGLQSVSPDVTDDSSYVGGS